MRPSGEAIGTDSTLASAGGAVAPSRSTPRDERPRLTRIPVDEQLITRGHEARKALDEVAPSAAADERILHQLVERQLPIALMLLELEEQLAARIALVLDDPNLALAVARTLRETVAMSAAMSKRIQATLSTAATLRAQRRFLVLHARTAESKSDV